MILLSRFTVHSSSVRYTLPWVKKALMAEVKQSSSSLYDSVVFLIVWIMQIYGPVYAEIIFFPGKCCI